MKNTNFSRYKIPNWINLISIIVVMILLFQMYACFFNPSLAYGKFENIDSNRQAILTLAGRNFVMIVVTLLALKSQNAGYLRITFCMNFFRELYDMLLVGYLNGFSLKGIGLMATFLVFLIPYVLALKKLRQLDSKTV
jgi:hypothetical protein